MNELNHSDDYLARLRQRLKQFSASEQDEILAEIESHIAEGLEDPRMGAQEREKQANVLAELGSPTEMADGLHNTHKNASRRLFWLGIGFAVVSILSLIWHGTHLIQNPDQAVGPSLGFFLTLTWLVPISPIFLLAALLRSNWLKIHQQQPRVRSAFVLAILTVTGGITSWFLWVFSQEGVLSTFPSPLIGVLVLLLSNMQLLIPWLVVLLLLIMLWRRTGSKPIPVNQ